MNIFRRRVQSFPTQPMYSAWNDIYQLKNVGNLNIINYSNRDSPMLTENVNQNEGSAFKLLFSMKKRVRFGQAVYLSGNIPQLGSWDIMHALRLVWNQGDCWTTTLIINSPPQKTIEFKFMIGNYNNTKFQDFLWEAGRNRVLQLPITPKTIVIEQEWNMEKVALNLLARKGIKQQKYYVIGDVEGLGSWSEKKEMIFIRKRQSSRDKQSEKSETPAIPIGHELHTFSFNIFRGIQSFRYYYLRQGGKLISERKPGRMFQFGKKTSQCRAVTHFKGETGIWEEARMDDLQVSDVTEEIYVGGYLKNIHDAQRLKERGIAAVLSIQSEQDYDAHGLSEHYLKLLCEQNGLAYKRCSIADMDEADFLLKAKQALSALHALLESHRRIYVHCSAGMYRSPQLIALYLTLFQGYTLQNAIETIQKSHPHARPSKDLLLQAVNRLKMKVV